MYFICDVYDSSEYGKIKNFKELKEQLIFEIDNDIENNIQDTDIVFSCLKILENIALGKDNVEYILENLEGYGWKIIDLLELQRDLEDIKEYWLANDEYVGDINEVIDKINKGVNNNE